MTFLSSLLRLHDFANHKGWSSRKQRSILFLLFKKHNYIFLSIGVLIFKCLQQRSTFHQLCICAPPHQNRVYETSTTHTSVLNYQHLSMLCCKLNFELRPLHYHVGNIKSHNLMCIKPMSHSLLKVFFVQNISFQIRRRSHYKHF